MKKLLLVTAFAMLATPVMAQTSDASMASVTDHYKFVVQQQPYNVEVCKQVRQQNTYNNGYTSSTDQLVGAVIGGAIGSEMGQGRGNDAMTLFGALIGASMAKDQQQLQQQHSYSYVTVCNVETRYKETSAKVYSHSTITFISNDRRYSVNFNK